MNRFKNPVPTSARRAAARSGDFFFRSGLRLPAINSLNNLMTVLILLPVTGCSFQSAQWESAKALWAMSAPATQPENETFWWDMEHGEESYRLFPVAWGSKTVLTDASRWMIVTQNSRITMIRDFQKNQQILLEESTDAAIVSSEMDGGADSSRRPLGSSYSGVRTEVSIVESPIGKTMESAKTKKSCSPPRFDSQSLRLITKCFLGEQETDLRMAEFDRSGNISGLRLNLLPDKTWEIYRSDDLVDAFEVKRYLERDVDEI